MSSDPIKLNLSRSELASSSNKHIWKLNDAILTLKTRQVSCLPKAPFEHHANVHWNLINAIPLIEKSLPPGSLKTQKCHEYRSLIPRAFLRWQIFTVGIVVEFVFGKVNKEGSESIGELLDIKQNCQLRSTIVKYFEEAWKNTHKYSRYTQDYSVQQNKFEK